MGDVRFFECLAHPVPITTIAAVPVDEQHRQGRGVCKDALVETLEWHAPGGAHHGGAKLARK